MIESEQVQHRGVEIMHGDAIHHGLIAEVVGLAEGMAAPHAATGHPQGERRGVVVAANELHLHPAAVFAHGRAPEFPAPHHQRVLQQSPLLEIGEQRHERAVHALALAFESVVQSLRFRGAVGVPPPVEQLDIPHPALRQPPRQQTVVGEGFLARFGAVELMDHRRFPGDVKGVAGVHLHAEGQFVLRQAGLGLRVPHFARRPFVQVVEGVERPAAESAGDAGRIGQEQDRIPLRPALDALVHRRQIARAPHRFAGIGILPAAGQYDEAGQVLVVRSQPVGRPRPGARSARILRAGVHQQLRRTVVELVGVHGLDEAHLVHHRRQQRQPVGHPLAAFAALPEGILRAEHLRHPLDEGELLPGQQRRRAILAIQALQLRLVVEEFQLARRPRHVQVDHPLGARRKRRRRRSQRIRRVLRRGSGCPPGAPRVGGQPKRPESAGAVPEKMPAGVVAQLFQVQQRVEVIHGVNG